MPSTMATNRVKRPMQIHYVSSSCSIVASFKEAPAIVAHAISMAPADAKEDGM